MSVVLAYIQIFASYFCGILLYFFPGIITYKQFALIMAVASSVYLLYEIIHRHGRIPAIAFQSFAVCASALLLYRFLTPALHGGSEPAQYYSNFLALAGQVLPSVLTACFIADHDEIQEKMKALAPYVALLFTIIALVCTLRPAAATSAKLTENLNGFDYQVVSYVAAYASGLLGFYLVCKDKAEQIWFFKSQTGIIVAFGALFLDILIILLSGGRGGFVTFILLGVVTLFFAMKSSTVSLKTIIKGVAIISVIVVGGYLAVRYVGKSTLSTIGFSRIVSLVSGGGDYQRAAKRVSALASFGESPFVGHGLGSVFYEIGEYSHNFFTDALVEGGLLLSVLLLSLLIKGFISAIKLIKRDYTNIFWVYIFLCGFIMSMFSGYYLTHFPLWWGLVFLIAKVRKPVIEWISRVFVD